MHKSQQFIFSEFFYVRTIFSSSCIEAFFLFSHWGIFFILAYSPIGAFFSSSHILPLGHLFVIIYLVLSPPPLLCLFFFSFSLSSLGPGRPQAQAPARGWRGPSPCIIRPHQWKPTCSIWSPLPRPPLVSFKSFRKCFDNECSFSGRSVISKYFGFRTKLFNWQFIRSSL